MRNEYYFTALDKKYNSIDEAVEFAQSIENEDDVFNEFEIITYTKDGEYICAQTVERNPYSGDFMYSNYIVWDKEKGDFADGVEKYFDVENEAISYGKALIAEGKYTPEELELHYLQQTLYEKLESSYKSFEELK